jgi:hypothetical protein
VDVLRVIGDAAEVMGRDGYTAIPNDLIAASAAVNDALTVLRMVERAWASGVPGYVDPNSPLAQVKSAIAGLAGANA